MTNNTRNPSRVYARAGARSYAPENQPLVTPNPSFERPYVREGSYARGCPKSGPRTPTRVRASARGRA
jgi:hypothetical protein